MKTHGGKIEVKNLSVKYSGHNPSAGDFHALKNLGFTTKPGEFVCILGPSGCGKTTTLLAIAGLLEPTEGKVLVDDTQVLAPSKEVQMILQQPHLFPWKTVAETIGFSLNVNGMDKTKSGLIIDKYLKLIGLDEFKDFYPHQLSIGMQQRVSIARALVAEPKILLMDEPFRAVDYQKRMELHDFLLSAIKSTGKTIVFVTHDIDEAILLADRILIMTPAPGTIKKEIKIDFQERTCE